MRISRQLNRFNTAGSLLNIKGCRSNSSTTSIVAARTCPGGEIVPGTVKTDNGRCSFKVACDGRLRKVSYIVDDGGSAREVKIKDLPPK